MITISTKKLLTLAGFVLFAAAAFFIPTEVFAQNVGASKTTKEITSNLGAEIITIPKLIAIGSYIIGAFFAVRSLFALKGFIENPDENPVTKVLGFGAVSALLILLPYIISVMTGTMLATEVDVSGSQGSFDATPGF